MKSYLGNGKEPGITGNKKLCSLDTSAGKAQSY